MQEGREAIKASMKRNIGNPFELKRLSPVPHQAIEDEVKATLPLKKFSSLPHHSDQLTNAASVTSGTVKTNECKEFSNRENKSALMQEGREAIKGTRKRNIRNPFKLKRLSPSDPDPHNH
ncbi:hypothetical protein V6N13_081963 [Hibiscus sabdariffa]